MTFHTFLLVYAGGFVSGVCVAMSLRDEWFADMQRELRELEEANERREKVHQGKDSD